MSVIFKIIKANWKINLFLSFLIGLAYGFGYTAGSHQSAWLKGISHGVYFMFVLTIFDALWFYPWDLG